MKAKIILFITMAFAIAILIIGAGKQEELILDSNDLDYLVISEVVSNNKSIIVDNLGAYSDYIELYNGSPSDIQLENYGLSDSGDLPLKWQLPNVVIKSGEYLVVYASKEDVSLQGEMLHTSFALDKSGDKVFLSTPEGEIISQVLVPESLSDMAYCLDLESNEYVFHTMGSPGSASVGYIIEDYQLYKQGLDINCDVESGFFTEGFLLELSVDYEGAEIYYTLDGSNPTHKSSRYDGGIAIEDRTGEQAKYASQMHHTFSNIYGNYYKFDTDDIELANVLKAQVFINDVPYGQILTKTYFVDQQGGERYSMPVITLSVDPEQFFDYTDGIYTVGKMLGAQAPSNPDGSTPANYNQRGREWEREAKLEYFDEMGVLQFSQNLGVRTFGGWSRSYPKKSLKLYPREDYDDSDLINYPIFDGLLDVNGETINSFSHLVLRNAGNDWDRTLIRDVLMTGLVSEVIDVQTYQPTILFINGEYWGIYNIREIVNAEYIESHYGVEKDDLTMVAISNGVELYEGKEEGLTAYNDLIEYVTDNDLSKTEHYDYVTSQIDVDNILTYYISQIYFHNTDWPGNNSKIWRKETDEVISDKTEIGHDGKWRFVIYDTDFGYGLYDWASYIDAFENATTPYGEQWPNPPHSTALLRSLLENDEFKDQFILRTSDLLNSVFSRDYVLEQIESLRAIYEPEMEENIERWFHTSGGNIDQWTDNVKVLTNYARLREIEMNNLLIKHLDLGQASRLTITANSGGYVRINDFIDVVNDTESFEGKYFSESTISLTAISQKGKSFVGWSGHITSSEPTITLVLEEDMVIEAVFE